MEARDMLRMLKGTEEDKASLFNFFLEKISGGESLDEIEVVFFETLKKELVKAPSVVVEMDATLKGEGKAFE